MCSNSILGMKSSTASLTDETKPLLDEKSDDGAKLPFLGQPALTSLAAARLALKYDLVMVPAFGLRIGDGKEFEVQFEAEIPHSDVLTMTQTFNDLLSARILEHPEQWYWLLQRWHGAQEG